MKWIQRYVAAVKAHLPDELKQDVSEELLANLQDQVADREELLDRALTEQEVLSIVKQQGHPKLTANRYLPRRSLVNEALFPVFTEVLKWVFTALFIGHAVMGLLQFVNTEGNHYVTITFSVLFDTLESWVWAFAIVSLIFYLASSDISSKSFFAHWDPSHLPAATDTGPQISRFESGMDLTFGILLLGAVNAVFLPDNATSWDIIANQALLQWLPAINAYLIGALLFSLTNLILPYYTRRRIIGEAILTLFGLGVTAMVWQVSSAFRVVRYDNDEIVKDYLIPDFGWQIAITVIAVVLVLELVSLARKARKFHH